MKDQIVTKIILTNILFFLVVCMWLHHQSETRRKGYEQELAQLQKEKSSQVLGWWYIDATTKQLTYIPRGDYKSSR